MAGLQDLIATIAQEEGEDPAYALAVAQRESSFNPAARASRSIAGLYQMSGGLRRQYGIGDSTDPETQTRGFLAFTRDLRDQMGSVLGRDPTGWETYAGHYFGPTRAARMISGAIPASTPVGDVFSPAELAGNPGLARAGTAGNVLASLRTDMGRRMTRFGGSGDGAPADDFSRYGQADSDFSEFGQAADTIKNASSNDGGNISGNENPPFNSGNSQPPANVDLKVNQDRPGTEVDLSGFGAPAPSAAVAMPPVQGLT